MAHSSKEPTRKRRRTAGGNKSDGSNASAQTDEVDENSEDSDPEVVEVAPTGKKLTFEERFQTSTRTNKEVLGKCSPLPHRDPV